MKADHSKEENQLNKQQILMESEKRDRRGWRLFTEDDLNRLKIEANRIHEIKRVGSDNVSVT